MNYQLPLQNRSYNKMRKRQLYSILKYLFVFTLFCPLYTAAQIYHNITHTSGTVTIGGVNVTVSPILAPTVNGYFCSFVGPYWIGATASTPNDGYLYEFSKPVKGVRILMGGTDPGEIIRFHINGVHYPISAGQIANTICTPKHIIDANGDLISPVGLISHSQIDLSPFSLIDSIRIENAGPSVYGTAYYISYLEPDTAIQVAEPLAGNVFCAGDSLYVPFNVSSRFQSNNVFTAELSDATGSFSSFSVIGTLVTDTAGKIACKLPNTVFTGTAYRIRVTSAKPYKASPPNSANLSIGSGIPANVSITTNSPQCAGDKLTLTANTSTSTVTYKWTGPNSFTATTKSIAFNRVLMSDAGRYHVTISNLGCHKKDSTDVTVIQSAYPLTTAGTIDICDKDTLKLLSSSAISGLSYNWSGPNGFSANAQNTTLPNAPLSASGNYIVSTTFNGCVTKDTVRVLVKPYPAKPVAGSNSPVCTGKNINLTASTVTPGVNWSWIGPQIYTSILQNPVINSTVLTRAGQYVVSAILNGCALSDTVNVTVNLTPDVYTTVNNNVCTNDTLKLSASSSFPLATIGWTGPNGFSMNAANGMIVHPTPAVAGKYVATATLNACTKTDTVNVSVFSPSFTVDATSNSPVCDRGLFNLNAISSQPGTSFTWSGPYGYSAAGAGTAFYIGTINAGTYILTGTYNHCKVYDTVMLEVKQLPNKPEANSNAPVCSTDTLKLTASTTAPNVSYAWAGPNGFISSAQNPGINHPSAAASGNYYVTITNTEGCGNKDTIAVVVNPTPAITATSNAPVCSGGSLNLLAVGNPSATYSWIGPGGFSASVQNPIISNVPIAASGRYIVNAMFNGCMGKDTVDITVRPSPSTPVISSNTPVCTDYNIQLHATSSAGASYIWTGPNGFLSTAQSTVRKNVTLNDGGVYTVIASLNGCPSAAANTNVLVNTAPFINIAVAGGDTTCPAINKTFTAVVANSISPGYKWTKNANPTVLGTTSTFSSSTIANNDVIRCEITDIAKCGTGFSDTSNEIVITVLPWLTPAVTITSTPLMPLAPYQKVEFNATPINGGSNPVYQWQRNGSDVIGATTNTWATQNLSNNDDISIVMTSSYRCALPVSVTSNKIKVIVLTGIANTAGADDIQIYPNPNNGIFTLKGDVHTSKPVSLQIINAVGQLVYEQNALPDNSWINTTINTAHLPNGAYILRIKTDTIINLPLIIRQ